MNSWKRFDETSIPNKEAFYSELNLKDISDEDYINAQKVSEELKIKNLGGYHDFYVQNDTLLLTDVFEKFRSKCIEIQELHDCNWTRTLSYLAELAKSLSFVVGTYLYGAFECMLLLSHVHISE